MYKVVIVDDEPIIVEGLCKSVKWEEMQCQVVGTAYSGEEGMELIREKRPDMVFTDIRMPYMDGLTMIAAVKSEFPHIQIAILTGYRDFEYARQAISLGVTRFLLKPSKMDEIKEALMEMTRRLSENSQYKKMNAQYLQQTDLSCEEKENLSFQSQEENKNEIIKLSIEDDIALDSAASSFIVKNAVAYIEEHYQEKLKLSDVADQVYVSQWHLSKLLNRYKGQNFSEILNGIRINKAKELLKDPTLRIGDIADEVGFLDMAHFSRVFKKQVGVSANEYRKHL